MKAKMVAIIPNYMSEVLPSTMEELIQGKVRNTSVDNIRTYEFEVPEPESSHTIEGDFSNSILQFYDEHGSILFFNLTLHKDKVEITQCMPPIDLDACVNEFKRQCKGQLDLVVAVATNHSISILKSGERTEDNSILYDFFIGDEAYKDETLELFVPGVYKCKIEYRQVEGVPHEDLELCFFDIEPQFLLEN